MSISTAFLPLPLLLSLLLVASPLHASWLPSFAQSLTSSPFSAPLRGARRFYASSRSVVSSVEPAPTCAVLECPPYKVVHEESDFSIRRYRDATWVETEALEDVSFTKATYRGFHSLFQYIQGENVNASHIPMTAPVLTSIIPSAGPFCSSAFTVSLYVPSKFSDPAPLPKSSQNPKLKITESKVVCIAVRKFSGFATDFNVAQEASLLAKSLERTPWEDVVDSEREEGEEAYSIAQYNSPLEFSKRVNEVWVKIPVDKKDLEDCLPVKKSYGKAKLVKEV